MKTVNNLKITSLDVMTSSELANSIIEDGITLSVKIDKSQHRKLKLLAVNLDTAMSEIVRAFLVQFIDQYKKENVVECTPESEE